MCARTKGTPCVALNHKCFKFDLESHDLHETTEKGTASLAPTECPTLGKQKGTSKSQHGKIYEVHCEERHGLKDCLTCDYVHVHGIGRGSKVNISPKSWSQEQHFGTKMILIGGSTKNLKNGGQDSPYDPLCTLDHNSDYKHSLFIKRASNERIGEAATFLHVLTNALLVYKGELP